MKVNKLLVRYLKIIIVCSSLDIINIQKILISFLPDVKCLKLLFTISDSSNKIAFILLLLGVLVYYGLVISGNNPL